MCAGAAGFPADMLHTIVANDTVRTGQLVSPMKIVTSARVAPKLVP